MRIGPKMQTVIDYVTSNPGCTKLAAGRAAWGKGEGNMAFVYGPVNRTIKAGLLRVEYGRGRHYLYLIGV